MGERTEIEDVKDAILDDIVNEEEKSATFFEERGARSWGFTDDLMRVYGAPATGKNTAEALNELIKEGVVTVEFITPEGLLDGDLGIKVSVLESKLEEARKKLKQLKSERYVKILRDMVNGNGNVNGVKLFYGLLLPSVTRSISLMNIIIYAEGSIKEAKELRLDVSKLNTEFLELKRRGWIMAIENGIREFKEVVESAQEDEKEPTFMPELLIQDIGEAIKDAKKEGLNVQSFEAEFQQIKARAENRWPNLNKKVASPY